MRIETLREFLYLAEVLNFSETARHFFMTQSSLSRHIIDLEKELDCELLLRNKQSVRLTSAGKLLADHAQELVDMHDGIIMDIEREQNSCEGTLSIGYLWGASSEFLDGCYKLFKREYPDATIFSRSLQPDMILDYLKNDKIDIGITMWPKDATSPLFEIRPLYTDEFVLMVDSSNELAKHEEVSVDELVGIIGIPEGFPHEENLNAFLRRSFDQAGIPYVSLPYIDDVDSMPLLFQDRSTMVVSCAHLAHYYGPRFKHITLKGIPLEFDICTLWKRSHQKHVFNVFAKCLQYSYDIHKALAH